MRILFDPPQVFGREFCTIFAALLGPDKGGTPCVVKQPSAFIARAFDDLAVEFFLLCERFRGFVRKRFKLSHRCRQVTKTFPKFSVGKIEVALTLASVLVKLAHPFGRFFAVTRDRFVCLVRNAFPDGFRCGTEKTISALDMVIEKVERFPGFYSLQPESHLAKLNRHWVNVHAVNTVANDFAECVSSDVPFLVAEEHGTVAGYVVAHQAADEGEILNLGVATAHRRQGLGRALVEGVVAMLAGRGVRVVYLEVRESNAGARRLYQSLGFGEVARRARYYRRPVEDAVILRAAIGSGGRRA